MASLVYASTLPAAEKAASRLPPMTINRCKAIWTQSLAGCWPRNGRTSIAGECRGTAWRSRNGAPLQPSSTVMHHVSLGCRPVKRNGTGGRLSGGRNAMHANFEIARENGFFPQKDEYGQQQFKLCVHHAKHVLNPYTLLEQYHGSIFFAQGLCDKVVHPKGMWYAELAAKCAWPLSAPCTGGCGA